MFFALGDLGDAGLVSLVGWGEGMGVGSAGWIGGC